MKKILKSFALVAAFVGMFAFAACNSGNVENVDTIDSVVVEEDTTPVDSIDTLFVEEVVAE